MIQWEEDVTDKGGWDFVKEIISKSFFRGFTRALDLTGAKKWPEISNERERDYEKLREDWENVGNYIREGTREYRRA